ncbi:MAG: YdcF family protein [Myxococcales bacterium]|nr:YdcF family protein [Myxococcales bacterium]
MGVFGLWFVGHLVWMMVDGFSDELKRSDVAVVFGNQVHPDGRPSLRLKMRLDRTIELYNKGLFRWVIVSGALGVEGHDEAVVMKRYLEKRGIPAKQILVDSAGKNTYKTAQYTAKILKRRKWHSILFVTQYFHIVRARLAFHRFGIQEVAGAHAWYHFESREFYSILREFVGYYAYLLKRYP